MLRPDENTHKFIISSTSRFVGEYENKNLLITHAWPSTENIGQLYAGQTENPYSRNYFIIVYKSEPYEKAPGVAIPNYDWLSEFICIYLGILFGKRFDNHGAVETNGFFFLANTNEVGTPIRFHDIGVNNHRPRCDLQFPLNLSEFKLLEPLISGKVDERVISIANAAGRFYLRSVRLFETDPEVAFLDLVTCGEILSNYYQYTDEELYDDGIRHILNTIEQNNGSEVANTIKSRLYQVRRKYVLTITKLLNAYFFQNTESKQGFASLKREDIIDRIKASYDLRSLYVHNGIKIGNWLDPHSFLNEVQVGIPVVESKDLQKLLCLTPTWTGMERIMRYCLLRFLHLNGVSIDKRLDGDKDVQDKRILRRKG
jgi:hypothetical protein